MIETHAEINLPLTTQADADSVAGHYVQKGFTLRAIGVYANVTGITGSPTAATVDVQDDGTDVVTAQDISSNGITTLSAAVHFAAGSLIELDVNFTGGSSPAFSGNIVLIGDWSEK